MYKNKIGVTVYPELLCFSNDSISCPDLRTRHPFSWCCAVSALDRNGGLE